jgi:hypothetical protein
MGQGEMLKEFLEGKVTTGRRLEDDVKTDPTKI